MKTRIERWLARRARARELAILWSRLDAPRSDCVVRGNNFWLHFQWTVT